MKKEFVEPKIEMFFLDSDINTDIGINVLTNSGQNDEGN
jgi:hypothetical protein